MDQAKAAQKVGIPKSTLASYELCIAPLKAGIALRFCLNLIISEEWLATGRFSSAENAGKQKGLPATTGLKEIFLRQCMDLKHSPEAASLGKGKLFSEAFDSVLAPIYAERIRAHFYSLGIPHTSWDQTNIELGSDICAVLIARYIRLLQSEAIARKCSPQYAAATYLGFILRMAMFGYHKCMKRPVTAAQVELPPELFSDTGIPIIAFMSEETAHDARQFAHIRTTPSNSSKREAVLGFTGKRRATR